MIISKNNQLQQILTGNQTTTAGITYVAGSKHTGQLYTKCSIKTETNKRYKKIKISITMAWAQQNHLIRHQWLAGWFGLVYTVGYNGEWRNGDDSTSTTTMTNIISDAEA